MRFNVASLGLVVTMFVVLVSAKPIVQTGPATDAAVGNPNQPQNQQSPQQPPPEEEKEEGLLPGLPAFDGLTSGLSDLPGVNDLTGNGLAGATSGDITDLAADLAPSGLLGFNNLGNVGDAADILNDPTKLADLGGATGALGEATGALDGKLRRRNEAAIVPAPAVAQGEPDENEDEPKEDEPKEDETKEDEPKEDEPNEDGIALARRQIEFEFEH